MLFRIHIPLFQRRIGIIFEQNAALYERSITHSISIVVGRFLAPPCPRPSGFSAGWSGDKNRYRQEKATTASIDGVYHVSNCPNAFFPLSGTI